MIGLRGVLSWVLAGMVLSTPAFGAADDKLPPHRDSTVIIRFRSNVQQLVQNAALLNVGANVVGRTATGALILHVGSGRVSAVLDLLKGRSEVLFAEPDYASLPTGDVQGASSPLATSQAALAAPAGSVLPNDTNIDRKSTRLNSSHRL